jgi:Arc/MetJ-type ribon-helix-helix transcriptional regulator
MRLITDLPESVAARIRDLVFRGRYDSTQSFVLAAVENQLALEAAPESFGLEGVAESAALLQRPSAAPEVVGGGKGSERPLDPMINRFFPVKLGARVLANLLLREQRENVLRRDLEAAAAQAAREYGLFLLDLDVKVGRRRWERLSTGLPVGPKERASKKRYVASFLCGDGEGALEALGLCARSANLVGEQVVGLTKAGADLALLESPLLDAGHYSAALSAAEVEFLREHVAGSVPGEAEAARVVLGVFREGAESQAVVLAAIGARYAVSGGALEQMAAGMLARLRELGAIGVAGTGAKATYQAGAGARSFLASQ